MEYIKIQTDTRCDWSGITTPRLNGHFKFWEESMMVIPNVIDNISESDYLNNRTLTWYEKQVQHHDKVMKEFKRIFRWQKK